MLIGRDAAFVDDAVMKIVNVFDMDADFLRSDRATVDDAAIKMGNAAFHQYAGRTADYAGIPDAITEGRPVIDVDAHAIGIGFDAAAIVDTVSEAGMTYDDTVMTFDRGICLVDNPAGEIANVPDIDSGCAGAQAFNQTMIADAALENRRIAGRVGNVDAMRGADYRTVGIVENAVGENRKIGDPDACAAGSDDEMAV
ncbi:hypothetical protein [Chelativorans sp. Marseille-P2723]|uniref:hypothetical protein n=1 Tax=Chelativorans sp. Marseille-P2723 TaxID=2709133 RepID=UPI00156FB0C2|nr:hypothetical protein [Chelativorans sp. Marseille-P2723]